MSRPDSEHTSHRDEMARRELWVERHDRIRDARYSKADFVTHMVGVMAYMDATLKESLPGYTISEPKFEMGNQSSERITFEIQGPDASALEIDPKVRKVLELMEKDLDTCPAFQRTSGGLKLHFEDDPSVMFDALRTNAPDTIKQYLPPQGRKL